MARAKRTHDAQVRRLGPGVYRAECLLQEHGCGCGWLGQVHEGPWWKSKAAAQVEADEHMGRQPVKRAAGPTPSRPVRISDELWGGVLAVSALEGVTASEVLRQAIAAYPPVAVEIANGRLASALTP